MIQRRGGSYQKLMSCWASSMVTRPDTRTRSRPTYRAPWKSRVDWSPTIPMISKQKNCSRRIWKSMTSFVKPIPQPK